MFILWKKSNICFFLAIFISLFLVQSGMTEEESANIKTIVVTGTGTITDNNVANAREKAISESLVTAVGVAMAKVVPIEVFVPNFQTMNEIIYTHSENFITGYRVLAETKYKNLYRVVVQVRVSVVKIKQQLIEIGIMVGEKEKPKVLLMVAEQNIEDLIPNYWWRETASEKENLTETILTKIFISKGFVIMEHVTPLQFTKDKNLFFETPDPDLKEVTELARHFQADTVVIGHASAEQTSNIMGENLRSFKGTVLIKAIRISKKEEIGKSFHTVVTVNADEAAGGREAISQAATEAGKDLALQIASSYKKEKNKTMEIKIVVEGTRILSNFVKFRQALNNLNNVREIRSSEMKADEATIVVKYNGDVNMLAESLMLKSFESFGINISEVLKDKLRIVLVPVDEIKESKLPVTKFSSEELKE